MTETVRALLEDGETEVLFEVEPSSGRTDAGPTDHVIRSIKKATLPAVRAAKEVLDVARAEAGPDEAEVTFAVRIDSQADAMVAKASVGGSFQVRLLWSGSKASEDAAPSAP